MKLPKIIELFRNKYKITSADKLADIIHAFELLEKGMKKEDTISLVFATYLYTHISSEEVRKRKVTARDVEDVIAMLLGGTVLDNNSRNNLFDENIGETDSQIAQYISSNRREKMDISFPGAYGLTVKTSLPTNKEINMGSFAREALFKDFLTPEEYGGERKSGLGSKPQLLNKFFLIQADNNWEKFYERFSLMVNAIFVDDLIFVVKGGNFLDLYFLKGQQFRTILLKLFRLGPNGAIRIINRYEGNSLRIDRKEILRLSHKIKLDFSEIKNTNTFKILTKLEELEERIIEKLSSQSNPGFEEILKSEISFLLESSKSK